MKEQENVFIGKNILQSDSDIMEPVNMVELFDLIRQPDQSLIEITSRLMAVKKLDKAVYKHQKTRLPYFIGATFADNLRNSKNFIEINWAIVDIDNCFNTIERELELKSMLKKDNRLALMFTSPSNEGLKLVFKLDKSITDSSLYTNFYKAFTAELARNYKLEKYIDFKTSDVTRVCFLNADADAYLNENAQSISWANYISKFDLINNRVEPEVKESVQLPDSQAIDDDVYTDILKILNPKTPKKREKMIFVPEALNSIEQPVTRYAAKLGIPVSTIKDINYGKKFTFVKGNHFAEINVFYGKNGFTIVISPKRGHHQQLSEAAKKVIETVVFDDLVRNPDFEKNNLSGIARRVNTSNLN